MSNREEIISQLNDLIEINNDRIKGYEKAIESLEPRDADLRVLFESMISNSRIHKSELKENVLLLAGEPEKGNTVMGSIYHAWMDFKSSFTVDERTNALDVCEFGEDAALKAYNTVLNSDVAIPLATRQMLEDQKSLLKKDHDEIKQLRDLEHKLHD